MTEAATITCMFLEIGSLRFTNYLETTPIERSPVTKVKDVGKEIRPAFATLSHFPAVLCVWACAAQIKRDELRRQFGEQIQIEYHFLRLFGDVPARIDAGWGDRGGAAERERFPAVKQVVAQTVRDPDAAARAGSARLETG
jgi:hypothetical protein